jgi:hypothetical protein
LVSSCLDVDFREKPSTKLGWMIWGGGKEPITGCLLVGRLGNLILSNVRAMRDLGLALHMSGIGFLSFLFNIGLQFSSTLSVLFWSSALLLLAGLELLLITLRGPGLDLLVCSHRCSPCEQYSPLSPNPSSPILPFSFLSTNKDSNLSPSISFLNIRSMMKHCNF